VTPILRTLALPVILVATMALASCGTSAGTSGTATAAAPSASSKPTGLGTPAREPVSGADVAFATMMIPAHTQALAMVDLALKQAADAKVKALAPKIKKVVAPEKARMTGWFTSVGNVAPGSPGSQDMSGMSGMAQHPQGMMTPKEMTALGKATGSAFDRLWLKMMVRNNKGALAMATEEVAKGGSPDVKKLAQEIVDSQPAQIANMSSILAGVSQP
jgi:uncharacterized protein (DUF305 family)